MGGGGWGGGVGGSDVRLDACVYPHAPVDAPNYGSHVPVDMTPRPCTNAQGAKNTPRL